MPTAADAAWCVYMLRCADGTVYTGYNDDSTRRLAVHNAGRSAKYTRGRLPAVLVYSEEYATKAEALRREAAIKKLSRAQKLMLAQQ